MYKLCKTEQSAARQRQLELKLAEMMNLYRYEEISVSDFCAYAQIPRKAFYRYFSSKDGALYALLDHTMLEYELFRMPGVMSDPQRDMEAFFSFWKKQKPLLDALKSSGLGGILVERSITNIADSLQNVPSEDPRQREHMVRFVVCGIMIMMVNWHHDNFSESVSEIARTALRLISQPLVPIVRELG